MRVTAIVRRRRGPSNSQKKTFCHVERLSRPSRTGIVSLGPTIPAWMCEAPLPSISIVTPNRLLESAGQDTQPHPLPMFGIVVLLNHESGRGTVGVERAHSPCLNTRALVRLSSTWAVTSTSSRSRLVRKMIVSVNSSILRGRASDRPRLPREHAHRQLCEIDQAFQTLAHAACP